MAGVKAFRSGKRPDPVEVFRRVASVVNTFIDFNRSLADQDTMSQLVACYVLASWFLPAFNVIGFFWPNGDRGSGKTQLLVVICEMAYLGQVILSGGTFASLRDLADYGATLAFDDAEGLSDPKRTDPDKRALLLAGNRRGNVVPVKEPAPNGTWRTRYVNTFCPRMFSAIQIPDAVLSSRTIVIPLIRTPDRARANADPLDYKLWPADRRALIDDLWSLALANLPKLQAYESQVNERASLTGRNLEPWRAVLAVALWLEDCGESGLWQRMEKLSQDYQAERPSLEISDLTALTIRAMLDCAVNAVNADSAVKWETPRQFEFQTADITNQAKTIATADELDIDVEHINSRRIGRVLGKMRMVRPGRDAKRKGWKVGASDLIRLAMSYALAVPDELQTTQPAPSPINGTNDTNGTNGTADEADKADLWEGAL